SSALVAVNQSANQQGQRSFRLAAAILLQAVPLMLLLFMVTPRLGPLWAVPLNSSTAKTGLSDSMSPGDISELMQSDAPAFRVTFTGANPQPHQLYWRGLVFSHFDGRRWAQNHMQSILSNIAWDKERRERQLNRVQFLGQRYQYEIIMEPSYQPWLLALNAPREWDDGIGIGPDNWLQHRRPVSQRLQYRVESYLDYRLQSEGLTDMQWRFERGLPPDSNPVTRATAQAWMAEEGSAERVIRRLLNYFNQDFTYTLKPPTLGQHSVDDFLWQSRQGFCQHFASSFAVFMRAAVVPARVVVGYQGGSYNPRDNYWLVRQRDAHAWAEVWLEGRGWVRVDPTAAVAPERIYDTLAERAPGAEGVLGGLRGLTPVLDLGDWVRRGWNDFVLGFDAARQRRLLQPLGLGELPPARLAALFALAAALALLWMLWLTARTGRE